MTSQPINAKWCTLLCLTTGTRGIIHVNPAGLSPYKLGYRYCSRCAVYFQTTDKRCKCCGLPLRTKSYQHKRFNVVSRY